MPYNPNQTKCSGRMGAVGESDATTTLRAARSVFDSYSRIFCEGLNPVSRYLSGAALVLAGGVALAQEVRPITLHYNTRIPYEYLEDGGVKGLVATPIEQAFRSAGVPFVWTETPVARQFHLVKSNVGMDCLAGRFKNDDRAQWARFSKPVYRDRPQGLLVKSSNAKLKAFGSMAAAVQAPEVVLLVKAGNSYGAVLDEAIRQRSKPPQTTYDESLNMLRQIQLGMADAFIIAAEEADGLMARANLPARDFTFLTYRDAPAGEMRYIMCSQQVPPSVMERLNAAIAFKER